MCLIIFIVYHVPRTIIKHFWKLQIHDQLSDCWARNVLILCNNSFFTLSGTRATREKSKHFITTQNLLPVNFQVFEKTNTSTKSQAEKSPSFLIVNCNKIVINENCILVSTSSVKNIYSCIQSYSYYMFKYNLLTIFFKYILVHVCIITSNVVN